MLLVEEPDTAVSWIGIGVAIAGNVVISLALNVQKLAHHRLNGTGFDEVNGSAEEANGNGNGRVDEEQPAPGENGNSHAFPFPPSEERGTSPMGTPKAPKIVIAGSPVNGRPNPRVFYRPENRNSPSARLLRDSSPSMRRYNSMGTPSIAEHEEEYEEQEEPKEPEQRHYLRSKLWWIGLTLMTLGETGNFLSYAYAPASIVAPLGTVALIANCIFAPLLLHEQLRKLELFGVALAIIGAVTVVASSESNDIRFSPEGLLKAILQPGFIAYTIIYIISGSCLIYLSNKEFGKKHVLVDMGLCALFGGFTVLSTKGVSSMLTLRGLSIFEEWITYPFLVVLTGTAIGQIKYLNRALQKFDSKVVVPTQFVFFNLSAIIGSAILYRDFENMQLHQFITFLYGCVTTFLGVFCLTYRPRVILEEDTSEPTAPTESAPLIPVANPVILRSRTSSASLGLAPGKYLLIATDSGAPPVAAIPIGGGARSRAMSTSGMSGSEGTTRGLWKPLSAV
ncbi:DUF803-domain-containing protein [Calocera cornea HHB12733]|uniref:DUF803-domain-containing protein n=1 Tax=Calocera cornea HHB12733 TaxID=1353952 RepID=A0A165KA84_9BASI|nr:DUF803-domain-containing protein [Calocera cornea HHB12733]